MVKASENHFKMNVFAQIVRQQEKRIGLHSAAHHMQSCMRHAVSQTYMAIQVFLRQIDARGIKWYLFF